MTARPLIVPGAMPSRDPNGRSLPAKLRFYDPGTVVTELKDVYSDATLVTPLSQPILSDQAGRWPPMFADDSETFNCAWSDQENDALIRSFESLTTAADATYAAQSAADASAAVASAAATAAAADAAAVTSVAAAFGDLSAAIATATAAATAAAASAAAAATFDPTTYALKATKVQAGGLVQGGGDLSTDRTLSVVAASAADVGNNLATTAVTGATLRALGASLNVTFASTLTFSVATYRFNVNVVLTGNMTLGQITGLVDGDTLCIYLIQDATGSRTLAVNSTYHDFGALGNPTLSTGANKRDRIEGRYDAATGKISWSFWKAA